MQRTFHWQFDGSDNPKHSFLQKGQYRSEGAAQVVVCLPNKHEAFRVQTPTSTKKKKKKKENIKLL
jgi:hypothetical protein